MGPPAGGYPLSATPPAPTHPPTPTPPAPAHPSPATPGAHPAITALRALGAASTSPGSNISTQRKTDQGHPNSGEENTDEKCEGPLITDCKRKAHSPPTEVQQQRQGSVRTRGAAQPGSAKGKVNHTNTLHKSPIVSTRTKPETRNAKREV